MSPGESTTRSSCATPTRTSRGAGGSRALSGPHDTTTGEEWLRGYRAALRAAGYPVNSDLERYCDFKEAGAFAAALELLAQPHRPDGSFVANNQMILGVLRALTAEGVAVPTEIAVSGFDDLPWWSMSHPSITAVAQPSYEMGRAAGQMLVDRIGGYEGPPRSQYFESRLIERQSSCLGTRPAAP
jgi:LacI family transcriptional regulator